jgi:hypothetical protein
MRNQPYVHIGGQYHMAPVLWSTCSLVRIRACLPAQTSHGGYDERTQNLRSVSRSAASIRQGAQQGL